LIADCGRNGLQGGRVALEHGFGQGHGAFMIGGVQFGRLD
jgi:hypothetical protein